MDVACNILNVSQYEHYAESMAARMSDQNEMHIIFHCWIRRKYGIKQRTAQQNKH